MFPNEHGTDLEKGVVLKTQTNDTVVEIIEPPVVATRLDGVDGRARSRSILSRLWPKSRPNDDHSGESFASKKTAAEGMMDIALLTANANQLRFLFVYNGESRTYEISVFLIIMSLILQVAVGVGLIFKRQMKNKGRQASWVNDFLVVGVFLITVINVFAATFTITHAPTGPVMPQVMVPPPYKS